MAVLGQAGRCPVSAAGGGGDWAGEKGVAGWGLSFRPPSLSGSPLRWSLLWPRGSLILTGRTLPSRPRVGGTRSEEGII